MKANPALIKYFVESISFPRNRFSFPNNMNIAEEFILNKFREYSWRVDKMSYEFSNISGYIDVPPYGPKIFERVMGANVVAVKPGSLNDAIIVMAHYDTVPSTPGANDNGSSVGVLLEIARILQNRNLSKTIILAATDMEEVGFFGSMALLKEMRSRYTIRGVINLETIGCYAKERNTQKLPMGFGLLYPGKYLDLNRRSGRGDFTAIIYNRSSMSIAENLSNSLRKILGRDASWLLRDPNDLPFIGKLLGKIAPFVKNFSRGDHVPFWDADIPAIFVTDTANFRSSHYHQASDTPEKLDYDRLAAISSSISDILSL